MQRIDYEFSSIDFDDPDSNDRQAGFVKAVHRAFMEPHPAEKVIDKYVEFAARDRMRATGAWLPAGAVGAGPVPVATYMSFDGTLNTGAGLTPVWMITDVTVSPAHRRRGLLTRLITADLEAAAASGTPIAALTASEGGIYGRFGFAPATFLEDVRVDLGPRFALRQEIQGVRVEIVPARELGTTPEDVFDAVHQRTRGSISRPSFYAAWIRGELDRETGGQDKAVHCAVALDTDEHPVGHVSWKYAGEKSGRRTIEIVELVGQCPDAHLALWHFVAGIDLAEIAEVSIAENDPLRWALRDPRVVRVVKREDLLWLRILDVGAALSSRPWQGNGELVLAIADTLGHADGTFTISVADGRPTVTPGGTPGGTPDLHLDVESLSALHLGGVDVTTLAAAGRVTGSTQAVDRLSRLLGDRVAPASRTFF